jgi:hypothetical protein
MDDAACGGLDGQRDGVDDGVSYRDGLEGEGADLERPSGGHWDQVELREIKAMLDQALSCELESVRWAEHWNVNGSKQVRQRSNVVLVSMCQDDPSHPVRALDDVIKTRVVDVYSEIG